jgi:hypothetical protein
MSYEDFNKLASGLSALATAAAILIGGIWAIYTFILKREGFPKIEFTVDASFVLKQNDSWIIEVIAFIDNKGLVKHTINHFTFDIRYTLPSDPIKCTEKFLVYIPHEAASGSWLPKGWDNTFIEPGVRTRYSILASVPGNATTVLLHGKFLYKNKDWHTADKLVAAPVYNHMEKQPTPGG